MYSFLYPSQLGYVRSLSADPSNTVFAIIRSHASASELLDFVAHHSHENIHVIEADNKDANALQVIVRSLGMSELLSMG